MKNSLRGQKELDLTGRNSRPVLFITDNMIEEIKQDIRNKRHPRFVSWKQVKQDADSALGRTRAIYFDRNSTEYRFSAIPSGLDARNLALVYRVTGELTYLEKAKEILLRFASAKPAPGTDETLWYADNGADNGPGVGLNIALTIPSFAEAFALVFHEWNHYERMLIKTWFYKLAGVIRRGHERWMENDYFEQQEGNNHLSAHALGLFACAVVLGDDDMFHYALDAKENPKNFYYMINRAILMPGDSLDPHDPAESAEPGELYDRYRIVTNRLGIAYSMFHLKFLLSFSEIALHNGIDFYHYTGEKGKNLLMPLQYYADFFIQNDPSIKGGYYRENKLEHEYAFCLYTLANKRYPGHHFIHEVLQAFEMRKTDCYEGEFFEHTMALTHYSPFERSSIRKHRAEKKRESMAARVSIRG